MKRRLCFFLILFAALTVGASGEEIRILAIGNSFTRNALKFFYPMARDSGVTNLTVGNMHISGCSLKKHWNNIRRDRRVYTYYKYDENGVTEKKKCAMSEAIADEPWDYVILQQSGGHSGVAKLYQPYLQNIIDYIGRNKTNPDAQICWFETWAFSRKCRADFFARYRFSQNRMFADILAAEASVILPNAQIRKIIPVGRVIQKLRQTTLGDTLNQPDGYHLNNFGCYAASLTFLDVLLGIAPEDAVGYLPPMPVLTKIVRECVRQTTKALPG